MQQLCLHYEFQVLLFCLNIQGRVSEKNNFLITDFHKLTYFGVFYIFACAGFSPSWGLFIVYVHVPVSVKAKVLISVAANLM